VALIDKIEQILAGFKDCAAGDVIPILQSLQTGLGYIPEEALSGVASLTGLFPAQVYGVATFYAQFSFTPRGRVHVKVCKGTACHVGAADFLIDAIERNFGVSPGETTTDGELSVETVACLGCCGLAPVIMVGEEKTYGKLDPDKVVKILKKELQ